MKLYHLAVAICLAAILAGPAAAQKNTIFNMVRSTGAVGAGCIPNATGRVTINSLGPVETMHVEISGLPPNTGFDFFVLQLPDAPFGMAWYQSDIKTNSSGVGVVDVAGRFSLETFIVAAGSGASPTPHKSGPFPDASSNPATPPVHMYHLGVWFDSPAAAVAAGCPNVETPFNGDHTAGIQALSTRNFGPLNGPLRRIP